MSEICVFAGTSEGRRLAECLAGQPVGVYACVATEYGEALLPPAENIRVSARRLDQGEMEALFAARRFDLVVDATHPFATRVSDCIVAACASTGTEYLRLNREETGEDGDAVMVDSIQGAAEYLKGHPGRALLATGSKELAPYALVPDFAERFYARVLPMQSSLAACEEAGFPPSHVIAMQGPFSVEMNVATLRAIRADYLVTKASGDSGGFRDKLEAARQAGARCVVIGRPAQRPGVSYGEAVRRIVDRFGLMLRRSVDVVGIGMGAPETLTFEADAALRRADCLVGAERMLKALERYGKPGFSEIAPGKIVARMDAHPEYRRFAVVMSGDTGFYSGAKKLLPLLEGDEVRVLPGLSSLQVLCARLGTSWDDVRAMSLHGRTGSVAPALRRHGKVFALLDGAEAVGRLCRELTAAGMGAARVSVGERLSYPDERIIRGTAASLMDCACAPLSAVLLEWDGPRGGLPVGLPDGAFLRQPGGEGTKAVPMTKSEARALSIAKLRLTEDAVVWDVGAGTGSVSVEAALNCPAGQVYAVECREDAAALIGENARRFGVNNLTVVRGTAPEALVELPAPTHVFIGGSSGGMVEIVDLALRKNPDVRVVANAIALETVGELAGIARRFSDCEIVQLTVARSREAGRYHLMTGMNPIYIAVLQGAKEADHED